MTTKDKVENDNGNIETATPHPALSRKGRGKDHDSKENDIKNTPPFGHPFSTKRGITTKALSVSGLPRATKHPRNDDERQNGK
jgi:hypothetical protein